MVHRACYSEQLLSFSCYTVCLLEHKKYENYIMNLNRLSAGQCRSTSTFTIMRRMACHWELALCVGHKSFTSHMIRISNVPVLGSLLPVLFYVRKFKVSAHHA